MAFLSGGSLIEGKTPVSLTSSSWFPSMPPMSTHGWPSAYAGIYSRQLWVNVVVSKRGRATARLPLPVYERDEQNRPRAENHPLAKLLLNPNPVMSGFNLWLWTSSTFDIYGDTFWLKRREGRRVAGIYPLHPASMSNDDGQWNFDNGKLKLTNIDEGDLVIFRDFHPESLTRGLSRIEPLRSTLENEWSARTATSSFWKRGARPAMGLVHPGNLSESAANRLKAQFDDVAAGADKTGVTVVLEEGMEPKPMTLTAEEAQYIETRKLNREEVCAAYDVPPPVVHILDRATFSNITEQMRSMYRDTMAPHLKGFEAAIDLDLRAAEWPNDDVYAEFLMDEVLRGDFETRSEALNKADWMTLAEKRKVENLPFIAGTDRIFLNTATMPLDAIDAQAQAIAAQTAASDDALAEVIPLSVARSVMGRLSWQRTLDQVDERTVLDGIPSFKGFAAVLSEARAAGEDVAGLRKRIMAMVRDVKVASVKAADRERHEASVRAVLVDFFTRQPSLDSALWDGDLADDLHAVAVTVSSAIGKSAVRDLGFDAGTYDTARTIDFLRAVAERLAVNINDTTRRQLAAEGADADQVYATARESRAAGIAAFATTLVSGFGVTEAGRQVATDDVAPTKTWNTGANPRASHAAMNGETVGIDEAFSNGMQWPGESGDVDETAGCNCSVEVSI